MLVSKMKKSPDSARLSGILLVNKPQGPTSNQVLQQLRRILGGVKAGHAGTLDPSAEGLLLICLGGGTKLVPFLTGLEKEYVGRLRFGEETDTQDATGRVVSRAAAGHLTLEGIREQLPSFIGEGFQIPPMFSAVKVSGERLYRLARQGEVVPRRRRPIFVREFTLLEWRNPEAEFRVRCGSGTYIRTLCHDLGRQCGSAGHLTALTRTAVGPFGLDQAMNVEEVRTTAEKSFLDLPIIPPAACLPHLPALRLEPGASGHVRQGRPFRPPAAGLTERLAVGESVRLLDVQGCLVAVARFMGNSEPMDFLRVF